MFDLAWTTLTVLWFAQIFWKHRVLAWIVEETWQATVAAAAAFLPSDADVTLLHLRGTDAETIARAARDGLLGRPPRPTTESLDGISEQSARQLLAEAQTAPSGAMLFSTRPG